MALTPSKPQSLQPQKTKVLSRISLNPSRQAFGTFFVFSYCWAYEDLVFEHFSEALKGQPSQTSNKLGAYWFSWSGDSSSPSPS